MRRLVTRFGWRLGVGRFVAGETLEAALPRVEELRVRGLDVILDLLGEFVASEAGAAGMTREVLETLRLLGPGGPASHLSVKPTQLGLVVAPELALDNARAIAREAAELGAHVCLDMENAPYVQKTLDLFAALRREGSTNVSTVLQSYLRRSLDDLEMLLSLDPLPSIRIVKGAYKEPPSYAYQDKGTVDRLFREMVFRGLEGGAAINVATHDERILAEVAAYIRGAGLHRDRYEFQLLYGVKPGLQQRLVREGHPVRIYVPYGSDWYGYFTRRLAERPANLAFVLRGLFG